MQQIFIQVVIRFLGLLEYYNSNFIAVTITFIIIYLTGDQTQKKCQRMSSHISSFLQTYYIMPIHQQITKCN